MSPEHWRGGRTRGRDRSRSRPGSRVGPLLRGLAWRRGLSLMILLVAVLAAAAASTGPTYYQAAQHSIVADSVHGATYLGQGVEVSDQGSLDALTTLESVVTGSVSRSPGGRLLGTAVRGQEVAYFPTPQQVTTIAWRDDLCAHLRILTGRCPEQAGDVVVSHALATLDHLAVGDPVSSPVARRIVGIYEPRSPDDRYWFGRGYFPQEGFFVNSTQQSQPVDALFTVRAGFDAAPPTAQGTSVVDLLLDLDGVTPQNVPALRATVNTLSQALAGVAPEAAVTTDIPAVLDEATASWQALAVPVVLITAQLLILVWLLLFLVIADAAEARGPEVALAKLRGLRRMQTLRFGLSEPVALLLAALPLGVLVGWAVTRVLARLVLRSGTPVEAGWMTVAGAAVAVSGGLLAAVLAARRTLSRSVTEQWRRTSGAGVRRGWVVDVAVLVATGAALAELYASGAIGSATTHVLALLVPGLIGLAVAVLASRVLPWACRAAAATTRARGGIGAFLTVRQVARRTSGMRTLVVLAAAFALATFTLSAWSVARDNIRDVAGTRTGAAAVLSVVPKPGEDLATTVDRLDPSGTQAMAVSDFVDFGNNGRRTLGVDTTRLSHIAFWRADFAPTPLADLARRLRPPAPEPITVTGSSLRLTVSGVALSQPLTVQIEVKAPHGSSATPVALGTLAPGSTTVQAALPPCPCQLRDLSLSSPTGQLPAATGRLTITGVDQLTAQGWRPVAAGLGPDGTAAPTWTWSGDTGPGIAGSATAGPTGLHLAFAVPFGSQPSWSAYSWPTPMPALVTGAVNALPRNPGLQVAGLDGALMPIDPVAVVPVPGAPDNAVMVDRTYALREAFDTSYLSEDEVWLAPGAVATFPARLRAAGVVVTGTQTAAAAARTLSQQGPALALALFLADAVAAAALAAAGAVLGLHLSGRRRGLELAALLTVGARRRSLRAGLLLEQGLVIGVGMLAGIGAGLLAVRLAVPSVPEFVTRPTQPALRYVPDVGLLATALGAGLVAVAVAAVVSAMTLMRRVRPERLREESG